MRRIRDPRQERLFEPFKAVFSDQGWKRAEKEWYGVFRHVILESLEKPVGRMANHFCPNNGTPTKEL